MNQPLVSICIPTYNASKTILTTLASILDQTYQNIEIIISDNASTDDTLRKIESLNSKRIKVITQATNLGAESNFQYCMQLGEGKYRAVYHADDVYSPDIVARQVAYLENHENVGAVLTSANFIDVQGEVIGRSKTFSQLGLGEHKHMMFNAVALIKSMLKHYNFLICPSGMVRASIYSKDIAVTRPELFASSADCDVWLRAADIANLAIIDEPLMNYRLSPEQHSNQYNQYRTTEADHLGLMRHWMALDHLKDNFTDDDHHWLKEQERRDALFCACRAVLINQRKLAKQWIAKAKTLKTKGLMIPTLYRFKYMLLASLAKIGSMPLMGFIVKPVIHKAVDRI